MKKAIGGIVIICVLLLAFVIVRPYLFGEDAETGKQTAESPALSTEEPAVESVIASAVNPTKEPVFGAEQSDAENVPQPTIEPTAMPVEEATPIPTAEPTATPVTVEIPEATKVPTPAVTATPNPETTQEPVEDGITDEDITYVAELLEVPEEKVREVIVRAEEAGYELDPDEILSGNFDVIGAWGIVTEVFGKKEATQLLLKVMKLGIF